ncbi:MAG TPA: AbrB/MazE/SpoVT family DNA-binding domain-containing protein [Candidatus Fraserbacteria bacterium]|nr:AbrB/MazE/SpoVT family DNA-binding domain-containing protein [Candidatus Fraserbacteria bacterium]
MNPKAKTLTLRGRGTLTLPAELRKRYRLEEGEPLTLLDLGGVFILAPKLTLVPKLVGELSRLREEAGLSVDELLEGQSEQRRKLYRERYGGQA